MPSDAPALTFREQRAWLAILDNCRLAQDFIEGMSEDTFAGDRRTFYAVTRCLAYEQVAESRVWRTVKERLPPLIASAETALGGAAPRQHTPR